MAYGKKKSSKPSRSFNERFAYEEARRAALKKQGLNRTMSLREAQSAAAGAVAAEYVKPSTVTRWGKK